MISCMDFKRTDGTTDWQAYNAASKAERDAEVAAGKYCCVCGTYLLFGQGYRQQCSSCKSMTTDTGSVDHRSHIRCPKCKSLETLEDGDSYHLYEEGDHEVECGGCGHKYQVETRVTYSFTSPALGQSAEPESDESEE